MNKYQPNQDFPTNNQRFTQNNTTRKTVENRITKRLLSLYPELKYVAQSYKSALPVNHNNSSSENIINFVEQTKQYIRRGYSEEKAFEKSEEKYQQELQKRIEQNRLTRGLAVDNQMRSFMNMYQQEVEMESNNKVKRLYQDTSKRQFIIDRQQEIDEETRKRQELETLRESIDKEEDNLSDYEEEPQNELESEHSLKKRMQYTRLLQKVVKTTPEQNGQLDNHQKYREAVTNFKEGNKNLFNHYYERASTLDRIGGLSEEELMKMLQTSPVQFQKQQKKMAHILHKHKITLDKEGEVDWSQCEDSRIITKYHKDPYVKMTLMQQDMHYEIPVKMQKMQQAREYKNRLERLQESTVQEIELGLSQEEQQEDSFNLEYEDVIFKEKTYMESHQREDEDSQLNKEMTQSERVRLERLEPILSQVDDKDSYYRFFENYGERLKRIEEKWLRSRIQDIETDSITPQRLKDKHQQLDNMVQDFRRMKFNMEQQSQKEAGQLLFEEHSVFTKDELMLSVNNNYEELQGYFQESDAVRRRDFKREQQDEKIKTLVKTKVLALDVADPVYEEGRFRQSSKDGLEKMRESYKEKSLKQMVESIKEGVWESTGGGRVIDDSEEVNMKESVEKYIRMKESGGLDIEQVTKSQLISAVKKKTAQGDKKGKKKTVVKKKETDFQRLAQQNQVMQEEREKAALDKIKREKEAKKNLKGL